MFCPFEKKNNPQEDYPKLLMAIKALFKDEKDPLIIMANGSALLNWFLEDINWVGFYIYNTKKDRLSLGPFQGLPACTLIPLGKGVCGRAFKEQTPLYVPAVEDFPGHIACDSASQSELVIPLKKSSCLLDIDSPLKNRFTLLEREGLEQVALLLDSLLKESLSEN